MRALAGDTAVPEHTLSAGASFGRLIELMARLRGPEGCPWDRQQTLRSLKPYILEEAYELVDSIESDSSSAVREELGDLLLEFLFVSQISVEEKRFTLTEVLEGLHQKIVRRHPHVFGEHEAGSPSEALAHWEGVKAREKRATHRASILADVPRALPALTRAAKMGARAAVVGFDWPDFRPIVAKLEEETRELVEAADSGAGDRIEEELGDLLFAVVNLARHLGVDPEEALTKSTAKFARRFRHIEEAISRRGGLLEKTPLEEMERLWEEAKRGRESE
jgi:MazG family protein